MVADCVHSMVEASLQHMLHSLKGRMVVQPGTVHNNDSQAADQVCSLLLNAVAVLGHCGEDLQADPFMFALKATVATSYRAALGYPNMTT